MALKKLKVISNGQSDGEYWKVTSLTVDFNARAMTVVIGLYKRKSFADQAVPPLDVMSYRMGIVPGVDPIAVNPKMTELVTLAYNYIKLRPEFSGSEDV